MTDNSEQKKRKDILSNHKRDGKKFIPPFNYLLPELQNVKWVDRPLPELFWLALLNEELGVSRGVKLASSIAKATVSAPDVQRTWFAPMSVYSKLNESQQKSVLITLESQGHIQDLRHALNPLVVLYPKCPLSFLYQSVPTTENRESAINRLKNVITDLFDKTTKSATFMQANAINIASVTDLLVVSRNVSLANFPALRDYPNTEESQKVASSVRAVILGFFSKIDIPGWWPKYFWNRGLEIDHCMINIEEPNE